MLTDNQIKFLKDTFNEVKTFAINKNFDELSEIRRTEIDETIFTVKLLPLSDGVELGLFFVIDGTVVDDFVDVKESENMTSSQYIGRIERIFNFEKQ